MDPLSFLLADPDSDPAGFFFIAVPDPNADSDPALQNCGANLNRKKTL